MVDSMLKIFAGSVGRSKTTMKLVLTLCYSYGQCLTQSIRKPELGLNGKTANLLWKVGSSSDASQTALLFKAIKLSIKKQRIQKLPIVSDMARNSLIVK